MDMKSRWTTVLLILMLAWCPAYVWLFPISKFLVTRFIPVLRTTFCRVVSLRRFIDLTHEQNHNFMWSVSFRLKFCGLLMRPPWDQLQFACGTLWVSWWNISTLKIKFHSRSFCTSFLVSNSHPENLVNRACFVVFHVGKHEIQLQ